MTTEIRALRGDITRYRSDIIVNAANASLLGGGGVDGAIHAAAGPHLLEATRLLGGAETGQAKMTDAFAITTAKKIIHTVGPIYSELSPQRAAALLADCYRNSLDLVGGYHSIAFPAISTGMYGYPSEAAARVAVDTIRVWIAEHPGTGLDTVALIAHSAGDLEVLERALAIAD